MINWNLEGIRQNVCDVTLKKFTQNWILHRNSSIASSSSVFFRLDAKKKRGWSLFYDTLISSLIAPFKSSNILYLCDLRRASLSSVFQLAGASINMRLCRDVNAAQIGGGLFTFLLESGLLLCGELIPLYFNFIRWIFVLFFLQIFVGLIILLVRLLSRFYFFALCLFLVGSSLDHFAVKDSSPTVLFLASKDRLLIVFSLFFEVVVFWIWVSRSNTVAKKPNSGWMGILREEKEFLGIFHVLCVVLLWQCCCVDFA